MDQHSIALDELAMTATCGSVVVVVAVQQADKLDLANAI